MAAAPFDFLKTGAQGGFESGVTQPTPPRPPLVFRVAGGQDAKKIAEGLRSLHKDVVVQDIGSSAVSVILPPSIKVGSDPVDLRTVAFLLQGHAALSDLEIGGQFEMCCGNGGGCCVN